MSGDDRLRMADRNLVADIYTGDGAYRFLTELCGIGPRPTGSEGEAEARRLLVTHLRASGLKHVREEPFAYTAWEPGPTALEAEGEALPCIPLPYSPAGDVAGRLVFLRDGEAYDWEEQAEAIRGNIVLISSRPPANFHRDMHRVEKYGRAVALGAAGFVWMRHEPGGLEETGSLELGSTERASIPGVAVSYEIGTKLLRRAALGPVTVQIRCEHQFRPATTYNVIAELSGVSGSDEWVAVGAHYDSHAIAPGAYDNGSGTAALTEVALALAQQQHALERSVRFIWFSGEEIGLLGSRAFVSTHREELRKTVMMLNLDGLGLSAYVRMALQGWPELVSVFRGLIQEMKDDATVGDALIPHTDSYPFALAGVPSAWVVNLPVGKIERGWGHTQHDTLDKVSSRFLRSDAAFVARLVLRLAQGAFTTPRHKERAEMIDLLRRADLLEALRFEGREL